MPLQANHAVALRRVLQAIVGVALLAPACGAGSADRSGFALSAEQVLVPETTTTTTLDPDRWEVEVATAKVPVVFVRCRPPAETGFGFDAEPASAAGTTTTAALPERGCPQPPVPEDRPALTPIPSETPNATSALAEGGWTFNNPTYFDNPLVFLVTENRGDWLRVMVPTRPNQQEGWIEAKDVELSTIRWHAEINVTSNRLRVWNGDELVIDTATVDGAPGSPTPLGRFYINEKVPKPPESFYGPWIFSTNGYSDTLETFEGGLPVFAIHGTNNPAEIGSDVSNGCVRVPVEAIAEMGRLVPAGTPVDVVA